MARPAQDRSRAQNDDAAEAHREDAVLEVEPKLYILKWRLGHEDIRTMINPHGHLVRR